MSWYLRRKVLPPAVTVLLILAAWIAVTANGLVPDYVIPGENGILFDSGNLEGCVRSIREACAHPLFGQGQVNPETLTRMRAYLSPETM